MKWIDNGAQFTPAEKTKLSGIESGADVTADHDPKAHGASSHTDRTRTFFVSPHFYTDGGVGALGVRLSANVVERTVYNLMMPSDFVSLTSVKVLWSAYTEYSSEGDWVLDVEVDYGSVGQQYNIHTSNDSDNVLNVPVYESRKLRTTTIDSGCFSSVAVGDLIRVLVERDADHASDDYPYDILIMGLVIEYIADE